MPTTDSPKQRPTISALAAGFQFAVCVLLPVGIGAYLDQRHGTRPWGIIAGFIIGLLVGTWSVFVPLWREVDTHHPTGPKDEDE